MKRSQIAVYLFSCVFMILGLISFQRPQSRKTDSQALYLVGGRLIDVKAQKAVENSLVVIEGNKISYAGKNKPLPKTPDAKIVDCSGRTLLPGLFDAHIHLGGPCTFGYIPLDEKRNLSGFLYSGVTSILDLADIEDWIFSLRESEKRGEMISPRIFSAGPALTCPGGHGTEYGVPMAVTPTNEKEAREAVGKLSLKKPDFIKIIYEKGSKRFPSLSYELMEAIIDEGHKNGLRIITHITTLEQAKDAVNAGTDGLAHIVADKEVDEELIEEMQGKNVFCIPTLAVFEALSGSSLPNQQFLKWPLLAKGVCQEIVEDLGEKSKQEEILKSAVLKREIFSMAKINLKKMEEAGIKLALGTDAGNPLVFFGPSVHRELELMVEAGLSPLEAVSAATKNSAEILGQGDKLGTIEQGQLADLLIVEGNPLENIQNTQDIFIVIKNGEILDRDKLAQEINPPQKPSLSTQTLPPLFDDFEDGDRKTNWKTEWRAFSDKLAGGSSIGEIELITPGANGSKNSLHFFGEVTTKFAYGFAGVEAPLGKEIGEYFDVSQYTGIKFKARGDRKTYQIVVSTAAVKDYDDFSTTFSALENWDKIVIPFSKLTQSGFGKKVEWTAKDVKAIEFMTVGAPHERFDLYIDDLSFYSEKKEVKEAPLAVSLNPDLIQKVQEAKSILQKGLNSWNQELFRNARDLFLNLLTKEKTENVYLLYYVALCDYRLASLYLTSNNKEESEKYNTEGQKYLERAIEVDPSFGESYALYSTLLGFDIALHQEKAMVLGFKSFEYFAKALQKDPENPRINLLKGVSLLYTPETYGGGASRAIEFLSKSANLFEKEDIKNPILPSWGKEESYTFLGMAYKQKKEYDKAKEFLKKALEVNPDFGMAQRELSEIEKS